MSLQPYARRIAARGLRNYASTSAAPRKNPSESDGPAFQPREELKTTKVGDVSIASIETNQPSARLAVYFRAGSRYETDTTQGLSHMLRVCAGLGTAGASHFGITRNVDYRGGNLSCTGGREYIGYTLEADRDNIARLDRYLQDVSVNQVFKPWEVADNVHRVRLEREMRSPETRVMELIHKAVFRKGLGYSVYSPKWMIGNHTSEMLKEFVDKNFGQASVVGIGLPHERVVEFAQRLGIKSSGTPQITTPGKFVAGAEVRKEARDTRGYVALAVEGSSYADPKSSLAALAAARALGTPPRLSRGLGSAGKLFAAFGGSELDSFAVGFSSSYADSGVLGAYITAPTSQINALTRKVAEIMGTVKFSAEDANRAKGIIKGDISLAHETGAGLMEELGTQSLLLGKATSLSEKLSLVDSITPEQMNQALSGKKLSMASYGNIANVPYLDELK